MASTRPSRFDSSIVRKKEETEELLVFGYSCKLFRDDEKALYIDQGKHLIPWMGDDTLKIDRYDVRGTVYDLRPLEPLGGGASDALWSSLSDAERKVEQLCDEERYRALYHNEAEEAMYQEEELKRLHKALDPQNSYGQVAYSYDNEAEQDPSKDPASNEPSETAEEEDEPFIPPQELDVPVGMVLPERTKLNAIIEKTAAFINTQGPQMEIILKMKQANNPQFSFLSFDCPLHQYYRHVLMAIKTGRYRTKQQKNQQEQNDFENSDHYLHPSLATAAKPVELAPSIPSISYKPSADCAYSMLVNKIKDRHSKLADDGSGSPGDGIGQDDNQSGAHTILPPPPDMQVIIDKMASYVLKNGRDFESVVRSKGDERFAFLDIGHQFHPYYEHKVRAYQGLEPPINFNQTAAATSSNLSSVKLNQSLVKKPQSPDKKRPILLPGYEYSDDSSESEGDDAEHSSEEKPKLTPVSFSIKKPKEAEILKEVKSALPVEEESSDEEAEVESDSVTKASAVSVEIKPASSEPETGISPASESPEEEMRRLQQLLREKELQLREQERQRKITEKRSQDIFQIEVPDTSSTVPPLPATPPPPPSMSPAASDTVENKPEVIKVTCLKEIEMPKHKETDSDVGTNCTPSVQSDLASEKIVIADELVNVIPETEVIDLTEEGDDLPKVSDTTRLERKRKAAAFLSRLQKERRVHKNGKAHHGSDSDTASRHSTPSPIRLKKDKSEASAGLFHEASIPKTSLMARLAASTHLPRQPGAEKTKTVKEKSRSHRKSESPVKPLKGRDERPHHRSKSKRKKSSSPSDLENERSRSRSRSISYSRSPSHKRRQGDDSDSEQRGHRHIKKDKSSHRKRQGSVEVAERHERHHRRHEDERRGHSLSQPSHSHSSRGRNRGRTREHTHSHSRGHTHSKKNDVQASEGDSSS